MTRPYIRSVLEINVAQICQTIGWHGISSASLELLTDLLHRYLMEMSKTTHSYAELFHRIQPNLNDVGLAFKAMNVNIVDLEEYVQYVDSVPSAVSVPDFPIKKESHLNFLKPGSQEVVIRPVHIHDYLPPIHPIIEEEQNKSSSKTSDQAASNSSLTEVSPNPQGLDGVFKRPGEPPSSFETPNKRLRLRYEEECGSRPTREISSVMMTTSGFISPAREGKLPEAKTPVTPVEPPQNLPTFFPTNSEFNNKLDKKGKKLHSEEKKLDKEKKRVKELFKPDKITVQDESKAKKLFNMKEVLKNKAKNGVVKSIHHAPCPVTGTSPLLSESLPTKTPIVKSSYNKIKAFTTKINRQAAVSSASSSVKITPYSVPSRLTNDDFLGTKLLSSPDKQKLNIFKKITKVKEEKFDKADQSDENIAKLVREDKLQKDTVSSTTASPPINPPLKNDIVKSPFAYTNYARMESSSTVKHEDAHSVVKEEEMHIPESSPIDSGPSDFSYDHDWSPPNTPSTPKTPELLHSPPRNKKTEKEKEKKRRKEKIKEKKSKSQKLKSPKEVVPPVCPRTPEGPINMTKERDVSKDMVPSHLHSYPFMPYAFPTGPGLIPPPLMPGPGLIPGGLMPGPGLIPGLIPNLNPYARLPLGMGKHGFGQPPHMPSLPMAPFIMPRKMAEEEKVTESLETIVPKCNVPPLLAPGNLKELEKDSYDTKALAIEKSEKRKEKEHKKEKKDREGKIKKKKDKKDKLKMKDKDRKRDKEEKRDKEKERIKKEKKIKRKEKERESEGSVPKLTLKLPVRSPSPEMKKLFIKPVVKKDEESPPPVVSSTNREPSPELAKISALVTRPKPKSSKSVSHDDSQISGSSSSVPVKTSPGPGRPRGSSNVVKNPPNIDRAHNKVPVVIPAKPAVDNDGNQVWICPACDRQDDGSPMIGCDDCDAWYHWVCVGIQVPPDDNEDWYCRVCISKKQQIVGAANGERKKKRKKNKKSH